MLVVSCIKQVPDARAGNFHQAGTEVGKGLPPAVSSADGHALEESLRLKERYGVRTVALSVGPSSAEVTLRRAVAVGVDNAILLSDSCFAAGGSKTTSSVLSAAIDRLANDEELAIVFCGIQAADDTAVQVGSEVASLLELRQLTRVARIEVLDLEKRSIRVRRKLEDRYETVEEQLPVLIAVTPEINQPRYPTVPMRLMAENVEIASWDNCFLQLDVGTPGQRVDCSCSAELFPELGSRGRPLVTV